MKRDPIDLPSKLHDGDPHAHTYIESCGREFAAYLDQELAAPPRYMVLNAAGVDRLRKTSPDLYPFYHAVVVERMTIKEASNHLACSLRTLERKLAIARSFVVNYVRHALTV